MKTMRNVLTGFEGRYGLEKQAGIGDFFRKIWNGGKSTSQALTKHTPPPNEVLRDVNDVVNRARTYVRTKTRKGMGIGAAAGSIGGGAIGYSRAEDDNKAKGVIRGALSGAFLGGGGGALAMNTIHGAKAVKGIQAYKEHAGKVLKMEGKKFTPLSFTNIENADTFHEHFKDYLYHPETKIPRSVHSPMDKVFESLGVKRNKYYTHDEIRKAFDGVKEVKKNKTYAGVFKHFDKDPVEDVITHVANKFNHSMNGAAAAAHSSDGKLTGILDKLRKEGIHTHKDFARKYHPDVNKNIPSDVKERYSDILEKLKENGQKTRPYFTASGDVQGAWDPVHSVNSLFDRIHQKIVKQNKDSTYKANRAADVFFQ